MTRPDGEYDDAWERWEAELAADPRLRKYLDRLPPADAPVSQEPAGGNDSAREREAQAAQMANGIPSEWMTRTTVGLLCATLAGVAVIAFYTPASTEAPPISEQARNKALINVWLLQNLGACASDLRQEAEKVHRNDPVGHSIEAYDQAIQLAEANHVPCILTSQGYTMVDPDNKLVTIHRDDLLPTDK